MTFSAVLYQVHYPDSDSCICFSFGSVSALELCPVLPALLISVNSKPDLPPGDRGDLQIPIARGSGLKQTFFSGEGGRGFE